MGYTSTLTGELAIQPPLKWSEYRGSEFLGDATTNTGLQFREERTTVETDDGSAVTRRAVAVYARWEDAAKFYSLADELARLAERYGDTHTFLGYLVRDGEDTQDVERYWIEGGTARSEKARMTWPDGTEVAFE